MDSPNVVEMGLSQMLTLLVDDSLETEFDVLFIFFVSLLSIGIYFLSFGYLITPFCLTYFLM